MTIQFQGTVALRLPADMKGFEKKAFLSRIEVLNHPKGRTSILNPNTSDEVVLVFSPSAKTDQRLLDMAERKRTDTMSSLQVAYHPENPFRTPEDIALEAVDRLKHPAASTYNDRLGRFLEGFLHAQAVHSFPASACLV